MATSISTPGFVLGAEYDSNDGRQIDWDNVTNKNSDGDKTVPAGTIMALQTDSTNGVKGKIVPRSLGIKDGSGSPAEFEATSILLAEANENSKTDSLSGYGVVLGGVIYGSLLPDSGDTDFDTWKTELESNGTGFVFEDYSDDRS